jgi:putative peptidoglycan lipid II flippase
MSNRRNISAATLVMAVATLFSRIAGLARDMVIARLFGAGLATDAFFMAFTIPNLLRRFFAEGSLTAAFIPSFSEIWHQRGEKQALRFASRCLTLLLLVMLVVVALGMLLSPWVVQVIGQGFAQIAGKLELTDQLNRIMFSYIGLVSLLALVTGILNVRGHFFVPALSPLFLNLAMIFSALWLGKFFAQPIYALAVGVLLGGVIQLGVQLPVLIRYGIRLRLDFGFHRDPAVRRVATLMLPGVAGIAIYQLNVVVTRLLASFLPQGSVSYLYYGQRLFEFPQGLFVVSLAQALLPTMSRQIAQGDEEGMRDSLGFAMALISAFTLPAVIGLILCAQPVYSLFFLGGEFDSTAMNRTAYALVCYAPGLIFVGYSRIAAQTFYALKDTRTPVRVSFWTLLVNVAVGLLLMQWFGYLGLALALTLASVFNATLLVVLLQRRVGGIIRQAILLPLLRVLPAVIVMGGATWAILTLGDWDVVGQRLSKALILGGAIAVGGLLFFVVCYCCRVDEVTRGLLLLKRRRN